MLSNKNKNRLPTTAGGQLQKIAPWRGAGAGRTSKEAPEAPDSLSEAGGAPSKGPSKVPEQPPSSLSVLGTCGPRTARVSGRGFSFAPSPNAIPTVSDARRGSDTKQVM